MRALVLAAVLLLAGCGQPPVPAPGVTTPVASSEGLTASNGYGTSGYVPSVEEPTDEQESVTRAVDGDTLVLHSGAKVRLIGIDTPEVGQCGYYEAKVLLASLTVGRTVTLTAAARTDTDRYGRLLRYVDVGSTDVGLRMITSGRAIARYDGRDGYGHHPRQEQYVAADADSPSANTC